MTTMAFLLHWTTVLLLGRNIITGLYTVYLHMWLQIQKQQFKKVVPLPAAVWAA